MDKDRMGANKTRKTTSIKIDPALWREAKISKRHSKIDPHLKFQNKIVDLFSDCGFSIIKRAGLREKSPDSIIEAEGIKILIEAKQAENKERIKTFPRLQNLIDEHVTKIKKYGANFAILALSGYTLPSKFKNIYTSKSEENLIKNVLKQDGVLLLDDDGIKYITNLSKALKEWARFPILGELGVKRTYGNIKVNGFLAKQNSLEFFVFKIRPSELLKIADVMRKEDVVYLKNETYQRLVDAKRVTRDIKDYIERLDSSFPTSIILVFRSKPSLVKGQLVIPIVYSSAMIVDGQHRLYAFCNTNAETRNNFELICTGFNINKLKKSRLSKNGEAGLFYTLNETAKRISPDLMISLGGEITGDKTSKVVRSLAYSPLFKNKIEWKSEKLHGKIHITTLSRTTPMGTIIKDKFYKSVLSEYFKESKTKGDIQIYRSVLIGYFSLLRKVFDKEYLDQKNYIVFSDTGVRIFLRLFIHLLKYTDGLKDFDKAKEVLEYLKTAQNFESVKFNKEFGGVYGEAGAGNAYKELNKKIREEFADFPSTSLEQSKRIDIIKIMGNKKNITEVKKKLASRLRNLKPLAKNLIIGELRYIDETTFDYLKDLPPDKTIEITVEGPVKNEKRVHKKLDELRKTGRDLHLLLLYKTRETEPGKKFLYAHRNPWLAGSNYCIKFEQDLKKDSLGSTKSSITVHDNPESLSEVQDLLTEIDNREDPKTGEEIHIKTI